MLKAGASRAIITPPVGLDLSGCAFGPSVGVLDDLEAQALVVECGGELAAVITADLLGFGQDVVARVRARVEASFGIPGHRVLLSGSHTHSGPAIFPLRDWGECDPAYLQVLESQLVGLVGVAQCKLETARVAMGVGRADITVNRRVPNGPIDPSVPVLRFDDADGRPIAVLYNYASHPVALHKYQNLLSPDYPGYAREVIRSALGKDVVVLFTLGAAGDANPLGFVYRQPSLQHAKRVGAMLGCEVAKIALGLDPRDESVFRAELAAVDLPVEPLPSPEELLAIRERSEGQLRKLTAEGRPHWDTTGAVIQLGWAEEALREWESGEMRRSRACEIQGIRLGDAAILAVPLEVFAATGLAIKDGSRAKLTIVSSNSNGALGYLPTSDVYGMGDYPSPRGLAPKVYDLYAFSSEAEPLVRREAARVLESLCADTPGWERGTTGGDFR